MSSQAKKIDSSVINGIDTGEVLGLAGRIAEDEDYGRFKWRAVNRWSAGNGARNETRIKDFYAGKRENQERRQAFTVGSDQPHFLAGTNTAPNAVEYVLHALTSCLTVTLTYHAAVQGIELESIETAAEGDMNARGFFGISGEVRKGYERIRVNMRIGSTASVETLKELAMHSPVYEMVSKAVPVELVLQKV